MVRLQMALRLKVSKARPIQFVSQLKQFAEKIISLQIESIWATSSQTNVLNWEKGTNPEPVSVRHWRLLWKQMSWCKVNISSQTQHRFYLQSKTNYHMFVLVWNLFEMIMHSERMDISGVKGDYSERSISLTPINVQYIWILQNQISTYGVQAVLE